MKVIDIKNVIESLPAERSAWRRGVRQYAMDLIEDLPDFQDLNPENCRGVLLNGAGSWKEWAYGGCGLVYDCYIAERLCTPSELRKKRGGELEPSSHESWLDVEARAVGQAAAAIKVIVSVGQREAGKKLLLTVSPF
jgi:hypothetical protein|nr:MAG TPA: hypothetical protein [Caudoviricetes sp.]